MALQTSGAITLNQIHVEAGGNSGTTASLNDADIRGLIGKASGATMSFSEWYGASAYTAPTIDTSFLSTPTANGYATYRVTDGVTSFTGQTSSFADRQTINLNTAAGRSLVVTIHARDTDGSGGQDFVKGWSTTGAATIDSSNVLVSGVTASSLLTSTVGTSATTLYNITGLPDPGDRVQVSIRVTVTSAMIGGRFLLYYNDDPDDDSEVFGVDIFLT